MLATPSIWDPHDLVEPMWILTNQIECVEKCVLEVVLLPSHVFAFYKGFDYGVSPFFFLMKAIYWTLMISYKLHRFLSLYFNFELLI